MINTTFPSLKASYLTTSIITIGLLSGCASAPQNPADPGIVKVEYTKELYGKDASLKHIPDEVRIVTQDATKTNVATQVATSILLGGFGFSGFSKDTFRGKQIEFDGPRNNLKISAPNEFVKRLENNINSITQTAPEHSNRTWNNPILVSNGSARLIYEKLMDGHDQHYRLINDMSVYKKKESAGMFTLVQSVAVDCSTQSEPILLAEWQANNYQLVKTELDNAMNTCEEAVLAKLPELLKE